VRHPLAEQRVGCGRLGVHVGVERVAGELGEVLHILLGHPPRPGHDRVPGSQLFQVLAERVHVGLPPLRAGDPAAGDRAQGVRVGLDRGALHVVQHAADAAHFLPAAGPPRAAVHQRG
jgi:hypothetical protein